MAVIIQLRNDTEANWQSANTILAVGEVALSTDVKNFKVGDGVTAWSGLAYWIGATPEPTLTLATATLTTSANSMTEGDPVTLTYGINLGDETIISVREVQYRNAGTSNVWTTFHSPTGNSGTVGFGIWENTDFRFRIVSESGEKFSPTRTVTVVAAPTYDTTLTGPSDESGGVYLNSEAGLQIKYNSQTPVADPTPYQTSLYFNSTQIGVVDYNVAYNGDALVIIYNGVTYTKTFVNGNLTINS